MDEPTPKRGCSVTQTTMSQDATGALTLSDDDDCIVSDCSDSDGEDLS